MEEKYIGPLLVKSISVDDIKTYTDGDVLIVEYDNGKKETITRKTFDLVSTTEPSDYSTVRNIKLKEILRDFYPLLSQYLLTIHNDQIDAKEARTKYLSDAMLVLTEYDIKSSEVDALFGPVVTELEMMVKSVINEIDNRLDRSSNYLWTADDSKFIPGVDVTLERTLIEAKKIISTIPINEGQ